MPEEPEQVLPQQRIAAAARIVEARAQALIEKQHHRAGDQRAHRRHEEDAGDHDHPHDHRDIPHAHPRRAAVHRGHDEIEAAQQEGDEFQSHRDEPQATTPSGVRL